MIKELQLIEIEVSKLPGNITRMNIEQLLSEFKKCIIQLESIKKEMPAYKEKCKNMINLAGELNAILKDE